jgi:ankyrin repeat protein
MVRLLQQHGADLSVRDNAGLTCLMYAGRGTAQAVSTWLLQSANFQPNAVDDDGHTVLMRAAINNRVNFVRFLVQAPHRFAVNVLSTGAKQSAVMLAAIHGRDTIVHWLTTEAGADLTLTDEHGYSAWRLAGQNGRLDLMLWLFETGVDTDVNEQDKQGFTILIRAAATGDIPLAQLLVGQLDADLEASCHQGRTALILSVQNSHLHLAELLVSAGANVSREDGSARNAVVIATNAGAWGMVRYLTEQLRRNKQFALWKTDTKTTYRSWGDLLEQTEQHYRANGCKGPCSVVLYAREHGISLLGIDAQNLNLLQYCVQCGRLRDVKMLVESAQFNLLHRVQSGRYAGCTLLTLAFQKKWLYVYIYLFLRIFAYQSNKPAEQYALKYAKQLRFLTPAHVEAFGTLAAVELDRCDKPLILALKLVWCFPTLQRVDLINSDAYEELVEAMQERVEARVKTIPSKFLPFMVMDEPDQLGQTVLAVAVEARNTPFLSLA